MPKVHDKGELNYLGKEDFGKVPQYLTQVKEEVRREKEMIDRYVKEQMGIQEEQPEVIEELSEDERHELLNALKAKWEIVNSKYQVISSLQIVVYRVVPDCAIIINIENNSFGVVGYCRSNSPKRKP